MKPVDSLVAGFIGAGMMGSALIEAAAKTIDGSRITVTDSARTNAEASASKFGCGIAGSNAELAKKSDVIFLCVKPAQIPAVTKEIAHELTGKILVSIAAGVSLAELAEHAGAQSGAEEVIRLMPNLPAAVGEGMIALCVRKGGENTAEAVSLVKELLKKAGRIEEIPESLMDAVIAVSGSGPAYAFMFIEALADAGVLLGMPRKQASSYAAQTLLGAAKFALESGRHPGDLKDAVCSPAGTTIEAVRALEQRGFRSAVIEAALAAGNKSKAMTGS
ncbi:MAG: pyrroline-5-carboxylate reductase [Treponemataceae bacterium]|nr:MAG: pyrroline-5-carboxylate reductase [Treponemataceae bacterium]